MSDTPLIPRYPVYVPSKGRHETPLTAKWLIEDKVPFYIVVEPQEVDAYTKALGDSIYCTVLPLPFSNRGSVIPARNWIREHSQANGFKRHWSFDDNIRRMRKLVGRRRLPIRGGVGMAAVEDFTELFSNVAISGFNYSTFVIGSVAEKPFIRNCRIYSATLFNNETPFAWRGRYNEDTDICLQALSAGWCTILFNKYCVDKMATMRMKGGNSATLYRGDGRTKMSRDLERMWPGVVETKRVYGRAQHRIVGNWTRFDTQLERDPSVPPLDPAKYKVDPTSVHPVKSEALRTLIEEIRE